MSLPRIRDVGLRPLQMIPSGGDENDEAEPETRWSLASGGDSEDPDGSDLEILVHNVSHKDLVVGIQSLRPDAAKALALARPKYSLYETISKRIFSFMTAELRKSLDSPTADALELRGTELASLRVLSFPESQRDPDSPRHISTPASLGYLPGGFDLTPPPPEAPGDGTNAAAVEAGETISGVPVDDVTGFKFRNDEHTRAALGGGLDIFGMPADDTVAVSDAKLSISGIFFPLLAVVLPKWRAFVNGRVGAPPGGGSQPRTRKLILLVSGVGEPRSESDRTEDNSTEFAAQLAALFLRRVYPDVDVRRVHSGTNIYRYTENIRFVKFELLPLLASFRDDQAQRWGAAWRDRLRVTVSFADGSPARVAAINAALRPYRPSFMHIWQLQTFWHSRQVCSDDVEILSFADVDTYPAVPTTEVDDEEVKWVCDEMQTFRQDFLDQIIKPTEASPANTHHDLANFWMRKSRKVVLAVLLVRKNGVGKPTLYRGTNMEVSMPTGSLCAERNVIGTALANDLTLKRRDLRIVAVLSVSLETPDAAPHPSALTSDASFDLGPPASMPTLKASASTPLLASMVTHAERHPLPVPELDDPPAIVRMHDGISDDLPPVDDEVAKGAIAEAIAETFPQPGGEATPGRHASDAVLPPNASRPGDLRGASSADSEKRSRSASIESDHTPQRRTVLRNLKPDGNQSPRSMRSRLKALMGLPPPPKHADVVLTESTDLNPLKPCGACMEWLRKVAEVNPQFAVLTFTDKECQGVFREHVFDER